MQFLYAGLDDYCRGGRADLEFGLQFVRETYCNLHFREYAGLEAVLGNRDVVYAWRHGGHHETTIRTGRCCNDRAGSGSLCCNGGARNGRARRIRYSTNESSRRTDLSRRCSGKRKCKYKGHRHILQCRSKSHAATSQRFNIFDLPDSSAKENKGYLVSLGAFSKGSPHPKRRLDNHCRFRCTLYTNNGTLASLKLAS